MEWYAWIAWLIAVLGGGYGAFRSWQTDRALKLLGERWRLEHFQNSAWMLTNRQTHTVLDVTIELPKGWGLVAVDGDLSKMAPNDFVKLTVSRRFAAASEIATLEWNRRGRKRSTDRVAFPPGNAS